MIVVLVILAILAAILIPTLTGWIDNAQEKAAIIEARNCVIAAETIAVERYGAHRAYDLTADKTETLTLAEAAAGGDILEISFGGSAKLLKLVYQASNGLVVTYENGSYSVAQAGNDPFADKANLSRIYGVMQEALGSPNGRYYYSGTADAAALSAALKAQGIDLDEMSAAWSIRFFGSDKWPKLYWTNADLSRYQEGDVIPVMAFTLTTHRYTVWNVRLITKDGQLCLGPEAGMITQVEGDDLQTYDQMMTDYNAYVQAHPQ